MSEAKRDHAVLSPSSASRWTVCTPSARFEQEFPDTTSEAAKEGTLAHRLGELIMQLKLQIITKQKYEVELKAIKRDPLYSVMMHSYCDDYAVFVLEKYYSAEKTAAIFLEKQTDLTAWIPESFGTVDVTIIEMNARVLEIVDFKFGKGVEVSAVENKQMKIYALGTLKEYYYFDFDIVRMTIYQPRLQSEPSVFEMPVTDLLHWGENELKTAAELAFAGAGHFVAGEHCQFCRAKGICKANGEKNLELADYDFAHVNRLTPDQVSDILDRAKPFRNWLKGVEDFAQSEALKGVKWPHYKLVEGRSNRTFKDEEGLTQTLLLSGIDPVQFQSTKLLGLGDMEEALGKALFNQIAAPFIEKPRGAPTLVPLSDDRPELNSAAQADIDFAEGDENQFI